MSFPSKWNWSCHTDDFGNILYSETWDFELGVKIRLPDVNMMVETEDDRADFSTSLAAVAAGRDRLFCKHRKLTRIQGGSRCDHCGMFFENYWVNGL
jgi:hypothetical protein